MAIARTQLALAIIERDDLESAAMTLKDECDRLQDELQLFGQYAWQLEDLHKAQEAFERHSHHYP